MTYSGTLSKALHVAKFLLVAVVVSVIQQVILRAATAYRIATIFGDFVPQVTDFRQRFRADMLPHAGRQAAHELCDHFCKLWSCILLLTIPARHE